MINIQRYSANNFNQWNDFLIRSKNGTFLIDRYYMEYHKDRFEDFSLLFYENDKLVSILPANLKGNILISHEGLTYGGMIFNSKMRLKTMLQIFDSLLKYLGANSVKRVIYKAIPHMYHVAPAEEDLYAIFRNGFQLYAREASSALNLKNDKINPKKQTGFNKASKTGLYLKETSSSFEILEIANQTLQNKYGIKAVHSYQEMDYLKRKFEKNIKILHVKLSDKVLGGAILYLCNKVVHVQYLFVTEEAKIMRALDFIVISLINMFRKTHEWFDYGKSTEDFGNFLNYNLLNAKEEFNMRTICYDTYYINFN